MFSRLKRLYKAGRISKENLKKAVEPRGWITKKQYKEITGETYKAITTTEETTG